MTIVPRIPAQVRKSHHAVYRCNFLVCWGKVRHIKKQGIFLKDNKKNDKCFNNRDYSLIFLMGIFLKHLWLIPNILKWQNCKIFIRLVPSPPEVFCKKDILKNLQNFTGKHLCRCLPVKFTNFLITPILKNICERLLLTKLNRNVNLWLSWRHRFLYNNITNC